jgi:hypothetical protein
MSRKLGHGVSAIGGAALLLFAVGCSDDESMVVRATTCAEGSRFSELGLPDGFESPTGKGYFFRCDLSEAMNVSAVLPIEVYSEDRRGDVIGWWYPARCGYPEGLVRVNEGPPSECASKSTVSTEPAP